MSEKNIYSAIADRLYNARELLKVYSVTGGMRAEIEAHLTAAMTLLEFHADKEAQELTFYRSIFNLSEKIRHKGSILICGRFYRPVSHKIKNRQPFSEMEAIPAMRDPPNAMPTSHNMRHVTLIEIQLIEERDL